MLSSVSSFKVIAHRGDWTRFQGPNGSGNSEAAIMAAANNSSVYAVETDFRLSSDGKIVCWHDPQAPSGQAVDMLEAEELADQGVLSADDVFNIAAVTGKVLLCDLKMPRTDLDFPLQVREEALSVGVDEEKLILGLHSVEELVAVRKASEDQPVLGFLAPGRTPRDHVLGEMPKFAEKGGTIGRVFEHKALDKKVTKSVCELPMPFWVMAGYDSQTPYFHGTGQKEVSGYTTVKRVADVIDTHSYHGILVNDPDKVMTAKYIASQKIRPR